MRRKLIKQGGTGLTFYVPKKWIDEQNLKPGNEIEVENVGENLLISSTETKRTKKRIELEIKESTESAVRTIIVNAYRAGYDKITLKFSGDVKYLTNVVNNHLIGFELFTKKPNLHIIESVAEPSYENFENIIQKQFFIILEMIRDIKSSAVVESDNKVKKYDNFLKRCISKKIYSTQASAFLWQFLADLTHISREFYHLHKYITTNKIKLNEKEESYIKEIEKMFLLLQKSYLTKDLSYITELHEIEKKQVYQKGFKLLKAKHPVFAHYLVSLARIVYLASSPLSGKLQVDQMIVEKKTH